MVRVPVRFTLQRAEVGRMFGAGGQVYIGVGRFADRVLIRAQPGGLLAFEVDGRKVFTKKVEHPGSKGQPFIRRALEEESVRGL